MKNQKNFERLESTLGYQFVDKELLTRALSHRSVGQQNNERLEFLGDSILNFCISELLYNKFSKASEGDLSRLRASLVKGDTLADIALEFGLGDYLLLGEGEMKSGGFRRPSILADAVEAIIGAIYLESGLEQVRKLLAIWFSERLDQLNLVKDTEKDAKTLLQEWLQARKLPLPEYQLVEVSGKAHEQLFKVSCSIAAKNIKPSFGEASNRRLAEKNAAADMLSVLSKT